VAVLPCYAEFWKRVVAALIDGIVIGIIAGVIALALEPRSGVFGQPSPVEAAVYTVFAAWMYFTLLESSARGATLGKLALGLRVTDQQGASISFARANARYLGKILSAATIGIGFLLAGFTARKQALHDLIANTLVVVA
jgi:uncharacterized RDD family membrane protein YckC